MTSVGLKLACPATSVIILASCLTLGPPPRVGDGAPHLEDPVAEAAYRATLERWTRRAEIYHGLDARAFLAATLETWEFREAKVFRLAEFKAMPVADREEALARERVDHARTIGVLLGFQANERRFDDLARKDSMWRIALVTEAGEAAPLSVRRLARPGTTTQAIYPYLESFWIGYEVEFPREFPNGASVLPQDATRVTLRLASAVGRADLVWEMGARPPEIQAWP